MHTLMANEIFDHIYKMIDVMAPAIDFVSIEEDIEEGKTFEDIRKSMSLDKYHFLGAFEKYDVDRKGELVEQLLINNIAPSRILILRYRDKSNMYYGIFRKKRNVKWL